MCSFYPSSFLPLKQRRASLSPYGAARSGPARIWRLPHAASRPLPGTAAARVRHVFRPGHIRPAARF